MVSDPPPSAIRFELPSTQIPVPVDRDAELHVIHRIIDYCESPSFDPASARAATSFGAQTPWVALQLGVLAEKLINDRKLKLAFHVALMAVDSAVSTASFPRLAANMLTLGNVLLAKGDVEAAIVT